MKNILGIIVFVFFGSLFGYSQFNYQSILKNDIGEIIKDTSVNFRISIAYDSPTATPVYSELHNISISTDGVINIIIGNGSASTGTYSDVDWSKNIYIKREVALSGGSSNFTDFGATRLNSIPKATYSENSKGLSVTESNTAVGISAMQNLTSTENVALGKNALMGSANASSTIGRNTAVGHSALSNLSTGNSNTSVGWLSLTVNNTGNENTSIGAHTMAVNESGSVNTALGRVALHWNYDGDYNVAIGSGALFANTSGNNNTSVGTGALNNVEESNNTGVGYYSGTSLVSGTLNTFLGYSSDGSNTVNNSTAIGANAKVTSSNTIQLGDGNITLINTSGTISATSFTGLGNDLLINSSNTTSSLLTIIEDLEAKINALTSSVESATLKTYNGRNFQSNIVTQTSIFTVSYNEIYEQPNWIEYSVRDVTASISRSGDFYGVDGIYTSNEDDYHDNHWDKGHLAPAAAFLDSQENLEATFSYLNCVLMKDNLNRYEWAQLESQIRTWANDLGVDIGVRVDMFFDYGHEVLDTGAHVPSRFLKTITLPSGYTFPNETISKKCFEFPNANTNGADWSSFEITCN